MPFSRHATPALLEAVELVAPGVEVGEVPADALSDEQQEQVRLHVARSVFGREFASEAEYDEFMEQRDEGRVFGKNNLINEAMLPFFGTGQDCFLLNEFLPEGTTMASFATLADYDRAHFDEQERFRLEGEEGVEPREYEGTLLWVWARWMDGGLVYGNLSIARHHLTAAMQELADGLAEARWPTEFVEGPEHGADAGEAGGEKFLKWDMRRLPSSHAMKNRLATRVSFKMIEHLGEVEWGPAFAATGDWAWRSRREEPGETDEDVVFSGAAAADKVRLRHWLEDLSALPDGASAYEEVRRAAEAVVRERMEKIMDAVDAAVADVDFDDETRQEKDERLIASVFEAAGLEQRI